MTSRKPRRKRGRNRPGSARRPKQPNVWWTNAPNGKEIELPLNVRKIRRVGGDIAGIAGEQAT